MKILHSMLIPERAVSADGVEVFDLPVNPLSVVLLNLRPLNDTGTLANFNRLMGLYGALNRVTILHRGAAVYSMSGRDAGALNFWRHGILPMGANEDNTDNERRCVTLPILLGRFAYDWRSCFPETKRGELTMELDVDIADTGYDGFRYSVEAIELLGAKPSEWERKTTVARTFAATGDNDVDLPLGNTVRGVLGFGTTPFGGASPAPTLGRMQLLMDNEQVGYAATDFEVARMLTSLMGRQPPTGQFHSHGTTTDGNAQTSVPTLGGPFNDAGGGEGWENYAFLDLDPTRDDTFSVDTQKANQFQVRVSAETADAARFVTIEKMRVNDMVG